MKSPLGLPAVLPTLTLAKDSFTILWKKRTDVGRLFLPAVALMGVIEWIKQQYTDPQDAKIQIVFFLVSCFISVLFATTCHRFTLRSNPSSQKGVLRLWSGNEWAYLVRGLHIGIMSLIVFSACMALCISLVDKPLYWIGAVVGGMCALYIWARLSITLPEIALGKKTDLIRAWDMSAGNGSRLVIVVWVLPLVFMLPSLMLFGSENPILFLLGQLGIYLSSLISLVMLSLAYDFLSEFYYKNRNDRPNFSQDEDNAPKETDKSGFDA